jgi:ABC-type dipeptide/oligopeptide/nickel transport system ATPase subunit
MTASDVRNIAYEICGLTKSYQGEAKVFALRESILPSACENSSFCWACRAVGNRHLSISFAGSTFQLRGGCRIRAKTSTVSTTPVARPTGGVRLARARERDARDETRSNPLAAEEALDMVELSHRLEPFSGDALSGGEQQRVAGALARTSHSKPS